MDEPSAYFSFVGIRRNILCMHKNLRRIVRTTTYANVLRRTENEPKLMSYRTSAYTSVCQRMQNISIRLHYNVLAQRTPTVWGYFAFVDIRWYTLNFVRSSVWVRFQFVAVGWHTLLFAQYVEDFCACTKIFDVCRRMNNTQRVRPSNATRTLCSFTIR